VPDLCIVLCTNTNSEVISIMFLLVMFARYSISHWHWVRNVCMCSTDYIGLVLRGIFPVPAIVSITFLNVRPKVAWEA
jgi:hypothetical protein